MCLKNTIQVRQLAVEKKCQVVPQNQRRQWPDWDAPLWQNFKGFPWCLYFFVMALSYQYRTLYFGEMRLWRRCWTFCQRLALRINIWQLCLNLNTSCWHFARFISSLGFDWSNKQGWQGCVKWIIVKLHASGCYYKPKKPLQLFCTSKSFQINMRLSWNRFVSKIPSGKSNLLVLLW